MNLRVPDELPTGKSLTHHMGAFVRGRLLAIAALIVVRIRPSPREWRVIRRSASSPRVRSTQLEQLLFEAVAPSRECADPAWFLALTREQDTAGIVAARLDGFMPIELLHDAAAAAAAVVHGRLRVREDRHVA